MMNQNNPLASLRSVREALKQVRCPTCGKRTVQLATGWRGHGVGQRGAAHYDATSLEERNPDVFCSCPPPEEPEDVKQTRATMEEAKRQYETVGIRYVGRQSWEAKIARHDAKIALDKANDAFNAAWQSWHQQENKKENEPMKSDTLVFRPYTFTIQAVLPEHIHDDTADPDNMFPLERPGFMLYNLERPAEQQKTGIGHWIDSETYDFPVFCPNHEVSGMALSRKKGPAEHWPTAHLVEKYLRLVVMEKPEVDWTLPLEDLAREYGLTHLGWICSRAWNEAAALISTTRAAKILDDLLFWNNRFLLLNLNGEYLQRLDQTRTLLTMPAGSPIGSAPIGIANAHNTIEHIFEEWGKYLMKHLPDEQYEDLECVRDLIAMLRYQQEKKEKEDEEKEGEARLSREE